MWLLALSCCLAEAHAAEPAAPVAIEIFKGPKALDVRAADYPQSEQREGHEGWVQVNFMIDPNGKPYEIAVVDSTGNPAFERSAVSAVKKWTFEPAMLGDQPIDAGHNFKLVFTFREPAKGASGTFVRAFKGLVKAIDAGDRTRADEEIAKLKVQNLYENAYYNVAYYQYYRKWGTEAQQLDALERAIASEKAPRYLEKEQFISALNSQLVLQARTQDFAGALKTWDRLQQNAPKESLARWTDVIAKIEAVRQDGSSYAVTGQINKGTSWFYELFKNRFQVEVANGRLSEVKLRCEKQYIFFRFEPGTQYQIANNAGSCALELVGEQGTQFQLIQS
jgi:TonB family protein